MMVTPVILSTFVYNISTVVDQTLFMDIMGFKRMASETATLYMACSPKILGAHQRADRACKFYVYCYDSCNFRQL